MLKVVWKCVCVCVCVCVLIEYQQVHNAVTANDVYNVQALLVKLKRDQLHSLNCTK